MEDFASRYPELFQEYCLEKNSLRPEEVRIEDLVWWHCSTHNYFWRTTVQNRIRGNKNGRLARCPVGANKIIVPGLNDFGTTFPHLAPYWHPSKNEVSLGEVAPRAKEKRWWACPIHSGEEWLISPDAMSRRTTLCPVCEDRKVLSGVNDLATVYPELASQWNHERNKDLPFGPSEVLYHSGKRVWWRCEENHEWATSIGNRHGGKSCPDCFRASASTLEAMVAGLLKASFPEVLVFQGRRPLKSKPQNLELDFWLPDLRLAFEVQDFATHSHRDDEPLQGRFLKYAEDKGLAPYKKGPTYHEAKRQMAKAQLGVDLHDLWDDEVRSGTYEKKVAQLINSALSR